MVKSDCSGAWVFHIDQFSTELKRAIRDHLAEICHGEDKFNSNSQAYSYKRTLKHFLERYNPKPESTKKGMVGELLTHILIKKYKTDFKQSSPFFNLEEMSIKKGFDLIFLQVEKEELWFTEVKSGESESQKSDVKNSLLLKNAHEDMSEKLNSKRESLWHNAINGATAAMVHGKIKDEVKKLLEDSLIETQEQSVKNSDQNVVLVSVLFNDLSDRVLLDNVYKFQVNIHQKSPYKQAIVFSIQKKTFEAIVTFLESEV